MIVIKTHCRDAWVAQWLSVCLRLRVWSQGSRIESPTSGSSQGARCETWSWNPRITPWTKDRRSTTGPPRRPSLCSLESFTLYQLQGLVLVSVIFFFHLTATYIHCCSLVASLPMSLFQAFYSDCYSSPTSFNLRFLLQHWNFQVTDPTTIILSIPTFLSLFPSLLT